MQSTTSDLDNQFERPLRCGLLPLTPNFRGRQGPAAESPRQEVLVKFGQARDACVAQRGLPDGKLPPSFKGGVLGPAPSL